MEQRQKCIPIGAHGDGVPISMLRGKASKTIYHGPTYCFLSQQSNRYTTLVCASHTWPKPRASLQHGLFSDLIAPRKRGPKNTHITKTEKQSQHHLVFKHEAAANPIPASTSPKLCWPALLVQLLSVRIGRDSSKPSYNPHPESKSQAWVRCQTLRHQDLGGINNVFFTVKLAYAVPLTRKLLANKVKTWLRAKMVSRNVSRAAGGRTNPLQPKTSSSILQERSNNFAYQTTSGLSTTTQFLRMSLTTGTNPLTSNALALSFRNGTRCTIFAVNLLIRQDVLFFL